MSCSLKVSVVYADVQKCLEEVRTVPPTIVQKCVPAVLGNCADGFVTSADIAEKAGEILGERLAARKILEGLR